MTTLRIPLPDRLNLTHRFGRTSDVGAPRTKAVADKPLSATTRPDADLVVVGAGPGGWAAALSALKSAKGPFRVVVLDKRSEWTRPQVVMLTRRTMRQLKKLGVNVKDERFTAIKNTKVVDVSGERPRRLPFINAIMRSMFSRMVPINGLQAAMQDTGLQKQIVLRTGVEAHDLDVDADGVTLKLNNEDGSEGTLRSRYVAVADGAKSVLREKLGIAFNNYSEANPGVIGIVDRKAGDVAPRPGIHVSKVKIGGETLRMIVQETPERASIAVDLPPHYPKDDASVAAHLRKAARLGHAAGNPDEYRYEFEPQEYVGQLRRAEKFHEGARAFLLGDSAHTTVQASGMGVNLAVHDGRSLGKALARMDRAGEAPLARRALANIYGAQVETSAKVVHALAKRAQMAKPSYEALIAAEAAGPERTLKVQTPGDKALRHEFNVASTLPPERVWEELTRSIRDSEKGTLWMHSLNRAKLVTPELKDGATLGVSYSGAPPVFYRIMNMHESPELHTVSYGALEGHPLTGGGTVRITPDGKGGSNLNWSVDYTGPAMMRMVTRGFMARVQRKLDSAMRQVERGEVYVSNKG